MIELKLTSGQVYRALPNSPVTIRERARVKRTTAAAVREEDLVVLSKSPMDEDLQEAAFRVWENRPENREVRERSEAWKEPLVELIKENDWSAKEICVQFRRKGVNLTPDQARRTFVNLETFAPRSIEQATIQAALEIADENPTPSEVEAYGKAVRRVRGIHKAAGRWVQKLGKTTYLEVDDDLVEEARDTHGLDIEALRSHFFIAKVAGKRGPVSLPGAYIGLHEDTTEDYE